jgi:Di-haem oxidoreductase, putative peroxidase
MRRAVMALYLGSILFAAGEAQAGPANRHRHRRPVPVNLSGFGAPLRGVAWSSTDLEIFAAGQSNFKEIDEIPKLGPVFNGVSCAACHSQPAIGGAGLFINEIRVRNNSAPGPVHIFAADNMLRLGPQRQGDTAIFGAGLAGEPVGCQITAPGCQLSACQKEEAARTTFRWNLPVCDPTSVSFASGGNCAVGRAANPTFGLGLVEAVSNQTLIDLASSEPPSVRGTVRMVTEYGQTRVARFGWKDDHATLRGFSADAYLNEMGVTNPDAQNEVSKCALDQTQFGVPLQTSEGVEDPADADGRADIDRFTDFMRALAPPPRLPQSESANAGAALFSQAGCDGCHTTDLTTDSNPASFIPPTSGGVPITDTLNSTLADNTFHPYSDFLLHDMGSLGDGITSDSAGPTMMRTAPLWGLRAKTVYLHDGRAHDIPSAIALHDGQGKAAAAAFSALSPDEQQNLVDFLGTL